MIKREYFIKTELNDGRGVLHSYRQFYCRTWFAAPGEALKNEVINIAEDIDCNPEDLIVSSFNRC